MVNGKTKMYLLIMIGGATILLFVCMFSIFSSLKNGIVYKPRMKIDEEIAEENVVDTNENVVENVTEEERDEELAEVPNLLKEDEEVDASIKEESAHEVLEPESYEVKVSGLDTGMLICSDGTEIKYLIPNGAEEDVDFVQRSDKYKGYKLDGDTISLRIYSSQSAESQMEKFRETLKYELEYTVNGITYTKFYGGYTEIYYHKINDDEYLVVNDLMKSISENQMNTFLAVNY